MEKNRYLVHDIYNVTFNLVMISEKVTKRDIIKYVKEAGANKGRKYETGEIEDTLRYLVENGRICEKENEYKVVL